MRRYYYIGDNLDDIEQVETELQDLGITEEQLHVLSDSDSETEKRHLHDVSSMFKKDVVRSGVLGAVLGAVFVCIIVAFAFVSGAQTMVDWLPYVILSIIIFGFCTWEGGLIGIQSGNREFRRFAEAIKNGKHVFFIDIEESFKDKLNLVMGLHKNLKAAGEGESTPLWIMASHRSWRSFIKAMP